MNSIAPFKKWSHFVSSGLDALLSPPVGNPSFSLPNFIAFVRFYFGWFRCRLRTLFDPVDSGGSVRVRQGLRLGPQSSHDGHDEGQHLPNDHRNPGAALVPGGVYRKGARGLRQAHAFLPVATRCKSANYLPCCGACSQRWALNTFLYLNTKYYSPCCGAFCNFFYTRRPKL